MVGYVVAAWASDLDVANGILPGYIMGLYFFTGYALRLQVQIAPDTLFVPGGCASQRAAKLVESSVKSWVLI